MIRPPRCSPKSGQSPPWERELYANHKLVPRGGQTVRRTPALAVVALVQGTVRLHRTLQVDLAVRHPKERVTIRPIAAQTLVHDVDHVTECRD